MSSVQRVAFLLIAAVIAVGALVVLGDSGSGDEPERSAATATPTPEATVTPIPEPEEAEPQPEPEPEPTAVGQPVAPLLSPAREAPLRFTEGDRIRFRVRTDVDEEIHVHGYDVYRDLPAGETTTVAFPADITGIFEVELHGSGEQLGRIRIDPR